MYLISIWFWLQVLLLPFLQLIVFSTSYWSTKMDPLTKWNLFLILYPEACYQWLNLGPHCTFGILTYHNGPSYKQKIAINFVPSRSSSPPLCCISLNFFETLKTLVQIDFQHKCKRSNFHPWHPKSTKMNPLQKHNASIFNVQNIRTYQLLFISNDIVIKIKSAKIKCFLRFSIAIIWSIPKKNR